MNELKLKNKIAIVTGGTKGIGKAIATKFAYEGASVFIVGRNKQAGEKVVKETQGQISFIQADVSKPDEVKKLVDQTVQQTGRLDILVNNAGVQHEQNIEHTSPEDWDKVMNVNLKSVFLCSKYAIPHMRHQGGGKIINTASIDGYWAEPNLGAYCTSKGGVLSLTKSIALDFARDGVLCNCICPGYIETEMTESYMNAQSDPEHARNQLANRHPVQRMGKPEDIAEAAFWLAIQESNFVTGQSITVDGGLTLGNIDF
ncbi:SDR family NAD(P)-dependent oxidoreductase [Pontibacillus marinus]|uniref:Short-chain dehydrogenase n=1 Tax=Pontibacillus marinus BH030004 = DSM 16465 TaxID=1385511 RepID=A0A0A5GFP9_9BACI|nr:glucose 1-dehydrogenase [Pontibacillus marinus]KGX90018.1 short-chain dehydrogenase [Pontibacillus marinus BH030004 = DSM 16465]